jgi:hypothetical protein
MNKGGFQVKKVIWLVLTAMLVSTMLMASAPLDSNWSFWDTNTKPKPDWIYTREVNNGEPGMEKVVFFNQVNLVYGNPDTTNNMGEYIYFKSTGTLYYWYTKQTVRVPTRGLCQWRYIYD